MDKNKNYAALKKFAFVQGIDLFGVADIAAIRDDFMLSPALVEDFQRAVCLGIRLSGAVLKEIKDAPTKIYFHHYRTANALLDQTALKVSNFIQKRGFAALPIPASQIVDWDKQKGHLSHKAIGVLAGLGWIGRNNLLINPALGGQFRIVTILTDMPLKADKPMKRDCAGCRACIVACPAGAIKDDPQDFDHIKCFEKLKDFQKQKLVDQYICGICVNVCKGRK